MTYGLLNSILYSANSAVVPNHWDSEPALCPGYLDPKNEDRIDFEAKLDGKAGRQSKSH